MDQPDQLYRDFEALQERLSRLSRASLRIDSIVGKLRCKLG